MGTRRAEYVDATRGLDVDEPDDVDEQDQDDEPDEPRARRVPAPVSTGAGWLLGLVLYGWVALPFFKGGPTGVKNLWRAKFLNQAADGSELP